MLWSSYTRTLLRCSMCFSTLLSILSENPMRMSADTLLFEVQNSAFDLCQILFEFDFVRILWQEYRAASS